MVNKNKQSNTNNDVKKMEVWGYNKFGDVQYFGYYKEEDFNNTSAKFKVAYYEYMKYFYDTKNKHTNGLSGRYKKAAKNLSKMEDIEGIFRYDCDKNIIRESVFTTEELFNL